VKRQTIKRTLRPEPFSLYLDPYIFESVSVFSLIYLMIFYVDEVHVYEACLLQHDL